MYCNSFVTIHILGVILLCYFVCGLTFYFKNCSGMKFSGSSESVECTVYVAVITGLRLMLAVSCDLSDTNIYLFQELLLSLAGGGIGSA